MANIALSKSILQQAVDALAEHGSQNAAAKALGVNRNTLQSRITLARQQGLTPGGGRVDPDDPQSLKAEVKRLRAELANAQEDALSRREIRARILNLKAAVDEAEPPAWVVSDRVHGDEHGVPTLFLSDFHWGEVVHAAQINGVNRYNLKVAHQRLADTVDTATHLLGIIDPKSRYPGIVVMLGGDMVSGNIHDELTATNELNTMPTVLDLFGALAAALKRLADQYGRVFVPCVSGNHGRDTNRIWSKDRNHTSFDWLLYCFLAKHFEGDARLTFYIPDGPDAYFRIYGHRYLLTHGDQFRGGDGMIGALGPIIRGDHKKRSRNAQIDMEYDVMCLGHWHQYIHHSRLIVNGSLKGYDEYAYSGNFGFEPPQQALWLTHPKHGITFRMPVRCDRAAPTPKTSWVSIAA